MPEWRIVAVLGLIGLALVLAGVLRRDDDRDFDTRFERAEQSIRALAEEIERDVARETPAP